MTDWADLETRVSRFLKEEAPIGPPERLIHATREQVAGTRQVRRPSVLGLRLPLVLFRPVGVAGALAMAAIVAMILILPNRQTASTGTASSPTPLNPASIAASSSPYVCPKGQGTCLGPLLEGNYASTSFVPTVRYSVPVGWTNTLDVRGEFDLRFAAGGQYTYPDGLKFYDGISIFRRPVAESATSKAPLAGIGTTATDLAQWLAGHVDLVASAPTAATVGAATGYRLVISVSTGARTAPDHCTTDHREPRCVSLFLSDDAAATYGFGLVGPETAVVYLLDLPSGETVMVVIDDVDGVDQAGLLTAASPVVNSLAFSP